MSLLLFKRGLVATITFVGLLGLASAHSVTAGEIDIHHPYAYPSRAGSNNGAVYIKSIGNRGADTDRLVAGKSTVAEVIEIHNMKVVDGVMRMRAIAGVDVPAGGTVDMSKGNPEGYHVMLLKLTKPLADGDRFPLTLQFERAGAIDVEVRVETQPSDTSMQDHGGHDAMKGDHGKMK